VACARNDPRWNALAQLKLNKSAHFAQMPPLPLDVHEANSLALSGVFVGVRQDEPRPVCDELLGGVCCCLTHPMGPVAVQCTLRGVRGWGQPLCREGHGELEKCSTYHIYAGSDGDTQCKACFRHFKGVTYRCHLLHSFYIGDMFEYNMCEACAQKKFSVGTTSKWRAGVVIDVSSAKIARVVFLKFPNIIHDIQLKDALQKRAVKLLHPDEACAGTSDKRLGLGLMDV